MNFEQLSKINERLKAIDVKGKGYVQVNERVKGFRELFPNGRIECEIIDLTDGVVTMKAFVYDEDGKLLATGFAQEKETSSYINKTSFIENCETSAVGRALGWVGIGVDGSMASAEEVANAIKNQNKSSDPKEVAKEVYPSRDEMQSVIAEHYADDQDNYAKMLKWAKATSLNDFTDAQIMTVYNKVKK